jgi:penicillin-binding protein 1C
MSRAPRSPGSALKPFIYALAFEQGLAHPETVLFDRPARYGAYAPQNFDLGYQGTVTARKALQMSLNLPAIEVLADVGPASFLARLHGAGAEIALPKDTPIGLAIGLGGLGISLVDLARLYAGLRARRRGAGVDRAARRRAPIIGAARRVTDPVAASTSPTSCAARRRRTMRSPAGSRSRPAPPTAFATRSRSASTEGRRSRSGSGGPTTARRPA